MRAYVTPVSQLSGSRCLCNGCVAWDCARADHAPPPPPSSRAAHSPPAPAQLLSASRKSWRCAAAVALAYAPHARPRPSAPLRGGRTCRRTRPRPAARAPAARTCSTGRRPSWGRRSRRMLVECSSCRFTSRRTTPSSRPRSTSTLRCAPARHGGLARRGRRRGESQPGVLSPGCWVASGRRGRLTRAPGVPPEHQRAGEHLPGHPEGAVEPRAHY
jgi:hypothetical protein